MICVLALVVFGILGIFSAAYRPVAMEAFDCVFRRMTLRKCQSGLDTRLKSRITGKIMVRSPSAARFVHRYFEVFSWFFVILFFASMAYSGYSLYNVAAYGNCNGPDSSAFCIFDPFKDSQAEPQCSISGAAVSPAPLRKMAVSRDDPSIGPVNAPVTVIEAGCFKCHYTKLAYPWVKKLLNDFPDEVHFVYKDFPLSANQDGACLFAEAARCANEQGKFWTYSDILFANQESTDADDLKGFASDIGLDTLKFDECLDSGKYKPVIEAEFEEGKAAGLYGTPTFFINGQIIVGPSSYRELKAAVEKELKG